MIRKRFVLALILLTSVGLSAQQPSIIETALASSVEGKISSMQMLIGFSDVQAQQLRKMELDFLLAINKAEHCFMCNKQKRIEKLKQQRDAALQEILERDQYIQYEAIENERIKKRPLRAD